MHDTLCKFMTKGVCAHRQIYEYASIHMYPFLNLLIHLYTWFCFMKFYYYGTRPIKLTAINDPRHVLTTFPQIKSDLSVKRNV